MLALSCLFGCNTLQRAYDNRGGAAYGFYTPGSTSITGSDSTGTVTVSGTEASVTKSATAASGSLNITGAEETHTVCTTTYQMEGGIDVPITTCNSLPDTGTLSVIIGSSPAFTATANYQSGSTDATVASAVASALNASGSPVTATASASTVTITAKITGPNGDYPLSFSNGQEFFAGSSSSALQGGINAGTYYDTGTMTVTVNGSSATANWQQGSTVASVASSLKTAIDSVAGGYVSASASGVVVTLTSLQGRTVSDWTVAVSWDNTNPGFFSSPSSTATKTNMSGGSDTNSSMLYGYFMPDQGGYATNGNLLSVTDYTMGQWSYSYDNLNPAHQRGCQHLVERQRE